LNASKIKGDTGKLKGRKKFVQKGEGSSAFLEG